MDRPRHSRCGLIVLITSAAVFFTSPAYAQSAGDTSPQGDGATFTLTGIVVNSVTGEPVSRALVHVGVHQQQMPRGVIRREGVAVTGITGAGYSDRGTLTDREGHFKFEGLPRTATIVTAKKPGFFSLEELTQGLFRGVRAEASPDRPNIALKLVPEAVIAGQITDAKGDPLEGVEVRVTGVDRVNGRRQFIQAKMARTDEEGAFRVAELRPGAYYVSAASLHRVGFGGPSKTAYPITYYPGVAELTEASPIQLAAGDHTRIDFALKEVPVIKVTGVVTGYPPGQQVAVQLMNQSGDPISLEERFDSPTGKFEARVVAAGLCIIRADSDDPQQQRLHAQLSFDPASAKPIQINLTPAQSIPVTIVTEKTKPAPADAGPVGGRVKQQYLPAWVTLRPLDFKHPDVSPRGEMGPNGPWLVLHDVEPGKYKVEVHPNPEGGPRYVKSILYGSTDLMHEDLTVTPGETSKIEVVLRDDGAVLQGSVRSGGTVTRAAVLVVPDYAPLDPRMAVAEANGTFRIDGLAPGEYKVFAFDSWLDGLDYADGAVLEQFASKAAQVSLRANDNVTVNVDVISRGE